MRYGVRDWDIDPGKVDLVGTNQRVNDPDVVLEDVMVSLVRLQWFGMTGRIGRGMGAAECMEVCRRDPGHQKGESALWPP